MSSDLMTSTMKSETGTPSVFATGGGVAVSVAAILAVGGGAEGRRSASVVKAAVAAWAVGTAAPAAPAIATPVRNFRRLNLVRVSSRVISASDRLRFPTPPLPVDRRWTTFIAMLVQRKIRCHGGHAI